MTAAHPDSEPEARVSDSPLAAASAGALAATLLVASALFLSHLGKAMDQAAAPTHQAEFAPLHPEDLNPLGPRREPLPLMADLELGDDPWPEPPAGGEPVHLASHRIHGQVSGPLVTLEVHREYVSHARYARAGEEVRERLETPPLTALHDFWITERGERIPGALQSRTEARADFEATVRRSKDPGLLEWITQGTYAFALYPVLQDGTPKHAGWRQDCVLETDAAGIVRLPLALGSLRTRELTIDLEVHEPRGVDAWHLPRGLRAEPIGEGRWRLRGHWKSLVHVPPQLLLAWRLPVPPANVESPLPAQRISDQGYVAQGIVRGRAREPLVLTLLGRSPGGMPPERVGHQGRSDGSRGPPIRLAAADTSPLEVPEGALERLRGMARVLAITHARGAQEPRARELAALSRRHRFVTPAASLYAKPGLEEDTGTWLGEGAIEAQARQDVRGPDPQRATPKYRVDFGSIVTPSFHSSRQGANLRACFANQKTLAGAVEMYNLDYNIDALREWPTSRKFTRSASTAPLFHPGEGSDAVGAHWYRLRLIQGEGPRSWLALEDMAQTLEDQGYLQMFPRDPRSHGRRSQGRDTYFLVDGRGDAVFCLNHGFIQSQAGPGASPREQLLSEDIHDEELLEMASTIPPGRLGQTRLRLVHGGEVELFLLLVVFELLWTLGLWAPRRRAAVAATGSFLAMLLPSILLLQLTSLVPLFRWGLTATWALGLLAALGITLGMLLSGQVGDWLHPGCAATSCDHPWRSRPPSVRRSMHGALEASSAYLRKLAMGTSLLLLGLGTIVLVAGLLITAGRPYSVYSTLGRYLPFYALFGALLTALGCVLGGDLTADTLKWIGKTDGEAFWSRHGPRLLLLCLVLAMPLLPLRHEPLVAGVNMVALGLLAVPRYLIPAHLLRRYAEELNCRGGPMEEAPAHRPPPACA